MNDDYNKYIYQKKIDLARSKRIEGKYFESIVLLEEVVERLRMYPGDRMAPIYLCQGLLTEIELLKNIQRLSNYNSLVEFVSEQNRICPIPEVWYKLWELLEHKKPVGAPELPRPWILGLWGIPKEAKRERFLEQIKYAETVGLINEVAEFLLKLTPEEWFYGDD